MVEEDRAYYDYYYPPADFFPQPAQAPKQSHTQSQNHTIHRRAFGSSGYEDPPVEEQEEERQAQPLTKGSRVLRRGRGNRPLQQEEEGKGEDERVERSQHKIVSRQGGRGHRGTAAGQRLRQTPSDHEYLSSQAGEQPFYDSEQSHDQFTPEYERYGDFETQEPAVKKPTRSIKYRVKTFNDEQNSDEISMDESDEVNRRGPKLIKFKQKKPSERMAAQIQSSEKDDKNDIIDLYTPKNTQITSKIDILKPYKGFSQPEFFQGPQWKYIRQSTNQNSK